MSQVSLVRELSPQFLLTLQSFVLVSRHMTLLFYCLNALIDLIFSSSRPLFSAKRSDKPDVHYLPSIKQQPD